MGDTQHPIFFKIKYLLELPYYRLSKKSYFKYYFWLVMQSIIIKIVSESIVNSIIT